MTTEVHAERPALPPFVTILFAPRATMRWLLDHRRDRGLILLVLLAMLSATLREPNWTGLDEAWQMLGTRMMVAIVVFGIVLLVVMTIAGFYLFAWIAALAGKFLEGSATAADTRTALAWGAVPFIYAILYRVPALLFWPAAYGVIRSDPQRTFVQVGSERIVYDPGALPDAPISQILIILALDLVVIGWSIVITSRTLAEAQQFSSWKGLTNLILACVLPIVAIGIIVVAAVMTARTGA